MGKLTPREVDAPEGRRTVGWTDQEKKVGVETECGSEGGVALESSKVRGPNCWCGAVPAAICGKTFFWCRI